MAVLSYDKRAVEKLNEVFNANVKKCSAALDDLVDLCLNEYGEYKALKEGAEKFSKDRTEALDKIFENLENTMFTINSNAATFLHDSRDFESLSEAKAWTEKLSEL